MASYPNVPAGLGANVVRADSPASVSTLGDPDGTTAESDPIINTLDQVFETVGQTLEENEGHKAEVAELKERLTQVESRLLNQGPSSAWVAIPAAQTMPEGEQGGGAMEWNWPLRREEYERYSRQLLVPGVGTEGQLKLKDSAVLIIGAGGLGCPAATYLAGAGVGKIGIVDGDVVEASNLHRQIGHATSRVGMLKVDSLITYLRDLNPLPVYVRYPVHLSAANAHEIFPHYDLVLDCTDRPSTRYLVSDAAVVHGKPLVSASALRTDGQLLVLNHPALPPGDGHGGPCYRCIFPKPPPPETVQGCGEGGVLGMAVGVMGVLQALEAAKVLLGLGEGGERGGDEMVFFSGLRRPQFRSARLGGKRRKGCVACSNTAFTPESLRTSSVDYEAFCGIVPSVNLLADEHRISATELAKFLRGQNLAESRYELLDVREPAHFAVCRLPQARNVPASTFLHRSRETAETGDEWWGPLRVRSGVRVFVICRIGNDSQAVAKKLIDGGWPGPVVDVRGGMRAWRDEVDPTTPFL